MKRRSNVTSLADGRSPASLINEEVEEMTREFRDWMDRVRVRQRVRGFLGGHGAPRWKLAWQRLRACWRGRRDGAVGLGARGEEPEPSNPPPIFLDWDEMAKELLQSMIAGFIEAWYEAEKLRRRFDDRLNEVEEKIADLKRDAEGTKCFQPSVSPHAYLGLMLLIGAGEFAFSAGSFAFAGIDALW